ncbi:MAG: hypothetical protein WA910_03295, partial [Sphingopyxis granuli]
MTAEIMTAPQHAPVLLTGEQAGLVEALGATLTAEQARWASGYFAGLVLGLARGGGAGALQKARLYTLLGKTAGGVGQRLQVFVDVG